MQEVAPAPPAQIMTSEMLLPQCPLHWSLDSRGRAACCRRLGVLGAVGDRFTGVTHLRDLITSPGSANHQSV